MPKGRFPFKRTIEFLSAGRVILRKEIKTITLGYSLEKESRGIRDFIFKDLPQLQYKNEEVQFLVFKDKPFPAVNIFYDDGKKVLIDCGWKKAPEILDTIEKIGAETERGRIAREMSVKYPARNHPANFGKFGHTYCMCEFPGQVPCPSRVRHPLVKTVKWWQKKDNKEES